MFSKFWHANNNVYQYSSHNDNEYFDDSDKTQPNDHNTRLASLFELMVD